MAGPSRSAPTSESVSGRTPSPASPVSPPPTSGEASFALRDKSHDIIAVQKMRGADASGVSNRPDTAIDQVVYINGIRTTEEDAWASAHIVKATLGVGDHELKVLYNPTENAVDSVAKVLGTSLSGPFGSGAEQVTTEALYHIVKSWLEGDSPRLRLVAHSQGSLLVQRVLERVHDECQESGGMRQLWLTRSPNIQTIWYAPIVQTLVPGPQAVCFFHSLDVPTRGLGGLYGLLPSIQRLTGFGDHVPIRAVLYQPPLDKMEDLLSNPTVVHQSFRLILDSPELYFKLFAEDPSTHAPSADLFATNLASSILQGGCADILHYELIRMGCERFGRDFASAFMALRTSNASQHKIKFGHFLIEDPLLSELRTCPKITPEPSTWTKVMTNLASLSQMTGTVGRQIKDTVGQILPKFD